MRQLLGIGLVVLSLLGIGEAQAFNFPSKAFQAVYEETGTVGGTATRTYSWDGKAHGRSETIRSSGRKDVAVIDTEKKTITMLMGDSTPPMTIPLRDDDLNPMACFGERIKAAGVSLGTKVIDGHPCVGMKYTFGETQEEIWNGQDIGIRVYSKVKTAYGVTESHLKSYRSGGVK